MGQPKTRNEHDEMGCCLFKIFEFRNYFKLFWLQHNSLFSFFVLKLLALFKIQMSNDNITILKFQLVNENLMK